jgi:hypothetical protein
MTSGMLTIKLIVTSFGPRNNLRSHANMLYFSRAGVSHLFALRYVRSAFNERI